MNKVILIIEYNDRPAQILSSESFTKLTKVQNKYEPLKAQLGIKSIRIEPLIDLEDFQE